MEGSSLDEASDAFRSKELEPRSATLSISSYSMNHVDGEEDGQCEMNGHGITTTASNGKCVPVMRSKSSGGLSMTEGSATRRLLCSDETIDNGYLFLEFVDDAEDDGKSQVELEVEDEDEDEEKPVKKSMLNYMYGLLSKSKTSIGSVNSLTTQEAESLESASLARASSRLEDEVESIGSGVTYRTIEDDGKEFEVCSTPPPKPKGLSKQQKKSSSMFSQFYFSSPFSGLNVSPRSSPPPLQQQHVHQSFSSFYKERKVPSNRSECNRIPLNFFDDHNPCGEEWTARLEMFLQSFVPLSSKNERIMSSACSSTEEEEYKYHSDEDRNIQGNNNNNMSVSQCETIMSSVTDTDPEEENDPKQNDDNVNFSDDEEQQEEDDEDDHTEGTNNEFQHGYRKASIADSLDTVQTPGSAIPPPPVNRRDSKNDIERDIPRTYPTLKYFRQKRVQENLAMVLTKIATTYPHIGYVQGMNYVAAQLLLNLNQNVDVAFSFFCKLMESPGYNLHGMYAPGLPALQRSITLLQDMLEQRKPKLMGKLHELGMGNLHFAYNWFLTMFAYTMPFETLNKVWSYFFAEGWTAIFRVSIVLITSLESEIMNGGSTENIMYALRAAPIFPPKNLVSSAFKIRFSDEEKRKIQNCIEV